MIENRKGLRAFAVFAFVVVLAGDFFRYSITWFGWSAIVLVTAAVAIVTLLRNRDRWRFNGLPYPLVLFVGLTVLSIAWSDYRGWTALAAFTTIMTVGAAVFFAVMFSLPEILRALGTALRIVLAGSLVFEFVVSAFIRRPILPWWTDYSGKKIYPAEYWSRDLLFKGDRIQGVVGNSNLLGFLALLGLIVFAIEFAARSINRGIAAVSLVIAVACLLLTRSGTVTVALLVVAVFTVILLFLRRARTVRARIGVYVISVAVILVGVVGAIVFRGPLLALIGKSPDLTGRTKIWAFVIHLASERPVAGWGWISYWVPFIPPFKGNAINGGIQLLQAHEAWLDVWFQLGIVGLVIFGALVLSTFVRSWALAVDRPQFGVGLPAPYSAVSLLPILLLVALLAQSLAESRLLLEYGMLLLAFIAVKSKRPDAIQRPADLARTVPVP